MNKILLVISIVLGLVAINISSIEDTTFFNNEPKIKVKETNSVSNLKLEEYVIGVVAAEMPASFNEEALKAQAIASRTYALHKINENKSDYDVIASVSNQGYINIADMKNKWQNDFEKYYTKVAKAVNDTKSLVIKYDNEIIEAYYFAMSNGYTENSSLVFQSQKDYLVSVKSAYEDSSIKNFEKEISMSKNEFCQKLSINCDKIIIGNIEKSLTSRVNNIVINNKSFKGTEVRSLLGLRSTDFNIDINDQVHITTRGYGHGVGMSQYGANKMAENGYKSSDILKYYYKNTEISKI